MYSTLKADGYLILTSVISSRATKCHIHIFTCPYTHIHTHIFLHTHTFLMSRCRRYHSHSQTTRSFKWHIYPYSHTHIFIHT